MLLFHFKSSRGKLQNVLNYKNKLCKALEEEEKYILECNEEMIKPHNRNCCISFIPCDELKENNLNTTKNNVLYLHEIYFMLEYIFNAFIRCSL